MSKIFVDRPKDTLSRWQGREWAARFRVNSWQRAEAVVKLARSVPPTAQRVIFHSVLNDRPGQRVSVRLVFRHTDRRVDPLRESDVRELVTDYLRIAQETGGPDG